ncbi:MAG: hypothetical protein M3P30_06960 [Chloroflexota bacterium]|nr:hypothetical protein [Chloroflexota bacterium]
MFRRATILILTGQCSRCETPLVRRENLDGSICRPCLRVLNADVVTKRQILFALSEAAEECLSAFA